MTGAMKGHTMFGWFQRLLPKTGNFFEMFEAHAASDPRRGRRDRRGCSRDPREHASTSARSSSASTTPTRSSATVLQTVRKTFLTPFDRGAITALIGAMDDTIDEMQADRARRSTSTKSTRFAPEMKDMAAIIVDAARLTAEAMPLLRDVGRNAARLHELTERLVRHGKPCRRHPPRRAQARACANTAQTNTLQFVVEREVYKHLERITDAFEDVANEIDGIVIDHA